MHTSTVIFGTLLIFAALTIPGVIESHKKEKLFKNSKWKLPTQGKIRLNLSDGQVVFFEESTNVNIIAEQEFALLVKYKDGSILKIVSQKYDNLFIAAAKCVEFKIGWKHNNFFNFKKNYQASILTNS